MTETRTNKDFAEMMANPELDPKVKGFLEMLQNDDDVPSDLLEKLCSGGLPTGLLDKLLEEDEVDEGKIKQADSFLKVSSPLSTGMNGTRLLLIRKTECS